MTRELWEGNMAFAEAAIRGGLQAYFGYPITPQTIIKKVSQKEGTIKGIKHLAKSDVQRRIIEFDAEMRQAAEKLDFERAIHLRDTIREMQKASS